jgi:hypothetical protein
MATAREIIQHLGEDVSEMARGEVELAKLELRGVGRILAVEGALVALGAAIALIGFTMLCVAAVVALAPVIPSLALRLVLMAVVYLAGGGAIAFGFAVKAKHDVVPRFREIAREGRVIVDSLRRGVRRVGGETDV